MPLIDVTTMVRASAERAFDLSLDVDAHTASMSRSGERIVGGVTSGRMALGDTVTWEARHIGVRWRMTSRITAYDPPHSFVDEQVSGPFRQWHHEHTFAWDESAGVTRMRDVIEFSSPLGPLGRVADALFIQRYMARLIADRNDYLARTLARNDLR